jgi:predicted small secreted protein
VSRITAVLACVAALVAGCDDVSGTGPQLSIAAPKGWRQVKVTSPVRLAAVDPLRVVRMSIVETRVPESLSFRQFSQNEEKEIALTTRARDLDVREAHLPGGRALRVTYSLRSKAVRQYFVRRGEFLYVLTLTCVPARASHYMNSFERCVRTFRLR